MGSLNSNVGKEGPRDGRKQMRLGNQRRRISPAEWCYSPAGGTHQKAATRTSGEKKSPAPWPGTSGGSGRTNGLHMVIREGGPEGEEGG